MTQTWIRAVVRRRSIAAEGIVALELAAADGTPLPAYEPGAHIDLKLPGGLIRQYSLCGLDGDGVYSIAVLRDPASRGGSAAVHERLAEGDAIEIGAPRNLFAIAPGTREALLIAGGIGITPILAMADRLHRTDVPFTLHYTARSPARMAFRETLAACAFAARVLLHVDDGPAEQRLSLPAVLRGPAPGRHLYVCGPGGLIDAVLTQARADGWDEDHLHREHFASPAVDFEPGGAFDLILARTRRTVPVRAGETAAMALIQAGVDVPMSCEQGICGTCLTPVLAGTPDHRDVFLTDEEQAANDVFTPCCSRSLTPSLTLDL